jgi:hypothetical protein
MARFVRDYVEVANFSSLDQLIAELTSLRDSLPAEAEAEIRLRGDDIFGRTLAVSFLRVQTDDEAACDARYALAGLSVDRPLAA